VLFRRLAHSLPLFSPQVLKHWASTSLGRDKMNVPINLLFDIELAKSRLQEEFNPITRSDDYREPASPRMECTRIKTSESAVSRSFRLPEVRGCAGISFQAF
jgi:hypothetical protein